MPSSTLFEKLWSMHVVRDLDDGAALIAIDRVFLHERTGSVALKSLDEAGRRVVDPTRVFCTMDHIVDTFPGRGDDTRMVGGKAAALNLAAAEARGEILIFGDARQSFERGAVAALKHALWTGDERSAFLHVWPDRQLPDRLGS